MRLTAYDHVLGVDHADRDPRSAARTPSTIRSTSRSSCSGSSPPRRPGSSSPPACWCCRSGRPRWSPSRRPRWTCCRAAGSCSVWERGGTTSSTRRSAPRSVIGLSRFDDQVEVLRKLWERRARRLRVFLPPDRASRTGAAAGRSIPVWMGGSAEPSLARSARIGDGHMFAGRHRAPLRSRGPAGRAHRGARTRPYQVRHGHVRGLRRRTRRVARAGTSVGRSRRHARCPMRR